MGAIAVAESDPNVIYVGMGEGPLRGQVSSDGDGVYKSTDGGDNHDLWIHPQLNDWMINGNDGTLIYAGANMNQITEYDRRSGQTRNIMAIPVQGLGLDTKDLRYRFNWNAPIVTSPHDYKTLYHAAQLVLKSTDGGASWEEISPDLTRDEEDKHGAGGGPIMGEAAGGSSTTTRSLTWWNLLTKPAPSG